MTTKTSPTKQKTKNKKVNLSKAIPLSSLIKELVEFELEFPNATAVIGRSGGYYSYGSTNLTIKGKVPYTAAELAEQEAALVEKELLVRAILAEKYGLK